MVELEQYKFTVNQYKEPMKELGVSLALSHKHEQIKELESEMREEGFWNDPDKAQEVTRKVKNLKDTVSAYHALELTLDDVSTMIELGNEENDASVIPDIEELLGEFEIEFDNLKIQTLLSGEYDKNNAIIRLNAGAGGTEACDWSSMLYRMYTRYADRKIMRLLPFMQVQEERNPVTGQECFTECIANGRIVTALRQKFLIISMEMRQESNPLHLK